MDAGHGHVRHPHRELPVAPWLHESASGLVLGEIISRHAGSKASFGAFAGLAPIGLAALGTTEVFELAELQSRRGASIMVALSLVAFVAILLAAPAPAPEDRRGHLQP